MAEEALVESEIADSATLVRTLDSRGDAPTSVVWYYLADAEAWRLLVAGPTFDSLLPKDAPRAYLKIVEALNQAHTQTLTVGEVKVEPSVSPLLDVARALVKTGPNDLVRAHFKGVMINGIYVPEMLIMRAA